MTQRTFSGGQEFDVDLVAEFQFAPKDFKESVLGLEKACGIPESKAQYIRILALQLLSQSIRIKENNAALQALKSSIKPPRLGEFFVCILVPTDRQAERLGDFEERYTTIWQPKFGTRVAKLIYLAQALRSVFAMVRVAAVAAMVDRIVRAFHS